MVNNEFSFALQIREPRLLGTETIYLQNVVKNDTSNNSLEKLKMARQSESSYSKWQKKSCIL